MVGQGVLCSTWPLKTSRPQHVATRVTPDMDIHLADEEGRKWRIVRTGPPSTSHIELQEG